MTLAICIHCGEQKFGAFVPCRLCGFAPRTVTEKAKSIILSDHHFPKKELLSYQLKVKEFGEIPVTSDGRLPFDSVFLATVARPIFDQAYFHHEQVNSETENIRCKRCGGVFRPEYECPFCLACTSETQSPFAKCDRCRILLEPGARFCPTCGTPTSRDEKVNPSDVGSYLALMTRRVSRSEPILGRHESIRAFRAKLAAEDIGGNDLEVEMVGLFAGEVQLARFFRYGAGLTACVLEVVDLYRHSFVIVDDDSSFANAKANLCLQRLDEYRDEMASNPDAWALPLGTRIARNCLEEDSCSASAVFEMSILFGFFLKVFEEPLRRRIFGA